MIQEDADSAEEVPFPDEMTIDGFGWRMVAHKRPGGKNGTTRYRMEFDDGEPVIAASAEYRRNEVSLVFMSKRGARIAFDFKLREWE